MAFNINARINLSGPSNLNQIVNQITSRLRNINASVNLHFSSNALLSLGSLNQKLTDVNNILKQVAANAITFQQAINNIAGAVNRLSTAASSSVQSFKNITSSSNNVTRSVQSGTDAIAEFGEQAGLATRRFLAFSLAAGSIVAFGVAVRQGLREAVQFERELVRLAQVSGDSRAEIAGVVTEITRLATSFGASSKDLVQASVTLRQAGYTASETKQALEALAQAALSTNFDNMAKNVEGLIAIMSQFKLSTSDATNAFGSINAVAAEFAVESKDILDAVTRAGGAFSSLGGNLNEFISVFTSVRATTREGADAIATGLRTIFARLQRQDTLDALKQLRIELRYTAEEARNLGNVNLADQFVGPYEAIRRISEGLKGIQATDPRFAAVVEQIGGYRQISRVLPLLQQGDLQDRALSVARGGTASLYASTERAQDSLINKTQKVAESFAELFRLITNSEGFKSFASVVLGLATGLAEVLKYAGPLIPLLTTLATIKVTSSLASFIPGFGKGFISNAGNYANIRGYSGGGLVRNYAGGGHVGGVGNSDTEPALLPAGSFVLRKAAVQALSGIKRMAVGGSLYPDDGTPIDVKYALFGKRSFTEKGERPTFTTKEGIDDKIWFLEPKKEKAEYFNQLLAKYNNQIKQDFTIEAGASATIEGIFREGYIHKLLGTTPKVPGQKRKVADLYSLNDIQKMSIGDNFEVVDYNDKGKRYSVNAMKFVAGEVKNILEAGKVSGAKNQILSTVEMLRTRNMFAAGGSSKDTVPAMLTPGEYVVSPEAVSRIGLPTLEYANKTGKLPGFNRGGFVNLATGGQPPISGSSYVYSGNYGSPIAALKEFYTKQTAAEGFTGKAQSDEIASRVLGYRLKLAESAQLQVEIANKRQQLASATSLEEKKILYLTIQEAQQKKKILDSELQITVNKDKILIPARAAPNAQGLGTPATPEISSIGSQGTGGGLKGTSDERQQAQLFRGFVAASVLIPYVNQFLSSNIGPATRDSGLGYQALKGGAAFAQGAALGGFVGQQGSQALQGKFAVAAPVVGALIGGLTGLVDALQQARKDILEAKIADAIQTFGSSLQFITTQIQQNAGALSSADLTSASQALASSLQNIDEKARENASHIYGLFRGSATAEQNARRTELRQQLGGSAGNIFSFLAQSARQVGLQNPNRPISELREQFVGANSGFNRSQINVLTQLNNQSFETILRQFNQDIIRGQTQARRQEAEGTTSRLISSFGQLAIAIESASFDVSKFDNVLKSIYGFGSGQISNVAPNSTAENLGNRLGTPAFESIVNRNLNIFGNNETASGLRDTLDALNQVSSTLPNILNQAFQGGLGGDSGTAGSQVRQALQAGGFGGAAYQSIVEEIVTKISQLDFNDLKKISADSVAFARQLISAFNPLIDVVQNLTKAQEQQIASLLQGLDQYNKLTSQAADTRGRAAGLQFQGIRARAEFDVANQGGTVFGRISEAQTLDAFNQRQRFLTQGTGVRDGSDVDQISTRLRELRARIERDSRGLSNASSYAETQRFATSLSRANDQASRLQQALLNLADATTQNVYAQERLKEIESERSSRLSFAERYITGGNEGRLEAQRGFQLIQSVQDRGYNLNNGFDQESATLIVRTLRELGTARLPFAGGEAANDILTRVLTQSGFAGQVQPQNLEEERTRLQNQIVQTNLDAAKAMQTAAELQRTTAETFFDRLLANQTTFLHNLQLELERVNVSTAQANLQGARARNQGILQQQSNVDYLRGIGVTDANSGQFLTGIGESVTQSRIGRLQQLFTPLIEARQTISSPGQVESTLNPAELSNFAARARRLATPPTTEAQATNFYIQQDAFDETLRRILAPLNITNESDFTAISRRVNQNLGTASSPSSTPERISQLIVRGVQEGLQDLSRQRIIGVGPAGSLNAESGEIQRFLDQRLGAGFGQRFAALGAIGEAGTAQTAGQDLLRNNISNFTDFNNAISRARTEIENLGTVLRNVRDVYARNLENRPGFVGPTREEAGFAGGGQAIGTDTIPAMLSPGEFIVNAQSARANLGLLRRVNSAKSAVYMADGGIAGIVAERQRRDEEERLRRERIRLEQQRELGLAPNALDAVRIRLAEENQRLIEQRLGFQARQDAARAAAEEAAQQPGIVPEALLNVRAAFQRAEQQRIDNQPAFIARQLAVQRQQAQEQADFDIRNPGVRQRNEAFLRARRRGIGPNPANQVFLNEDALYENDARLRALGSSISNPGGAAAYLASGRSLNPFLQNQSRNILTSQLAEHVGLGDQGSLLGQSLNALNRQNLASIRGISRLAPPRRFATGGYVGTDTVPALLSPGEFVFNARATSNIGAGNLANAQRFAEGGLVGGGASSDNGFITAFNNFNNTANRFIEAMSAFPSSISLEGNHRVEVIVNGADVLNGIMPEIKSLISNATSSAINKMITEKFPDVGPVNNSSSNPYNTI